MPDGIGDGFAKQLLQIKLEPDRDRCLLAIGGDLAVYRPLLAEPLGKRAKFHDRLGEFDLAVPPKRHHEAADLALFLDHQALELVELRANCSAGHR